MRVSLDWLAEWIDLPPAAELVDRLTLGGLEIENVERTGPDLSDFVVGEVRERSAHPNADRLSVCQVDLGEDHLLEVVCGAPNVAVGQKVAVGRPGSTLPDGTKLKKTKIRGVVSNGMICSERELGLGDTHEGILVLEADAPVGASLNEVLPAGDTVLDLEITPNRGDWASLLGIAREVRAQFGGSLRLPPYAPAEGARPTREDIEVGIEDPEGCYRYVARVVRGVRVGPSPDWLAAKLETAGMRPVNLVVDVTNLVLLEFGQPLHAFDLSTLGGSLIRVRRARRRESLLTLDGQTRKLDEGDLVIADAERVVAIAGVMGGLETEVRDQTQDIVLESAHFHPSTIRRTARRLGLHSESSYRFERGVDPEGVRRAADRAATLLSELAGGEVSQEAVEVSGARFPTSQEIALDPARCNRLLGTALSTEEVVALLSRVEVRGVLDARGTLRCTIPSHRRDLDLPVDLVEEVARMYGYERIPSTLPLGELCETTRPRIYALEERVRDGLRAAGLIETRSFPGIAERDLDALRLAEDDPRRAGVRIQNPIVEAESQLRPMLLPSLLRAASTNLARQVDRVRLFEVSHVFRRKADGARPDEPTFAAAVLTRGVPQNLWEPREPPPLFFEMRGVAENLLADLGMPAEFRAGSAQPYLHPGAAGELAVGKLTVAWVGALHPEVAAHFEIDAPCAVIELDLSAVERSVATAPRFESVSRQPAVRRDIAVLLDRGCQAGEVLEAIRKSGGSNLLSVDLFDRYEGKGIPEGRLSLAFRLVFQRPDRTLKESEIKKATERVVQTLAHRFGGELR